MKSFVFASCFAISTTFAEWIKVSLFLTLFTTFAQEDRSRIPIKWQQSVPGQGVTVRINNALDPSYHPYFFTSIKNWGNASQLGVPASIQFNVSTIPPSASACVNGIYGEIVVCNADYGKTSWVGIELSATDGGTMLKSIVKVNDYYLARVPPDYKQYTLCHEIGHSIGLEHQDENFYNKGTQSCMDYTSYVKDSKQPNKVDYEKLIQLYGKLPTPPISVPVTAPKPPPTNVILVGTPKKVTSQSKPIPVSYGKLVTRVTTKPMKASSKPKSSTNMPVSSKPSVEPTSQPSHSKSPVHKPSVNPTNTPTMRPTPLPCCSYDNKSCGMAGFCDSSKYICQIQCAGIWLDGKTRQQREESNCKGLKDKQCAASYECCGNSLCQPNPYLGYSVCFPGPPTMSPSKRPSSRPTKSMIPSSAPSKLTVPPTDPKRVTSIPIQKHETSQSQQQVQEVTVIDPMHCLCPQTCSRNILSSYADQFQTCRYYINYQMKQNAMSELYACLLISQAYATCGGTSCNPYLCPGSELQRRVLLSGGYRGIASATTLQQSVKLDTGIMNFHERIPRRITLQQLNLTSIERDIGIERVLLGDLIQTSSDSLRYSLVKDGGSTLVTEVKFSFISDDLLKYFESLQDL